jgi:CheY-like chemotaxis protein
LLGGDLEVRSTPGLGSVFTASIDAGATETMTWSDTLDAASSAEPTAYEPDQDRLKSTRVLVVDDNPENVRIIRFLLLEAGAVVDSAVNGQAGVDAVLAAEEQDRPFDVVLMDMMMPVMDGYEATRELRRSGCQVPVLAITAFAMAGDREKCLSAGCDDHLSKPIVPQLLIDAVAHHCKPETTADTTENRDRIRSSMARDARIASIVDEYVDHMQEVIPQIEKAGRERDAIALRKLTHKLRGTGASYGFQEVTDAAAACEDAVVSGIGWDEIDPLGRRMIDVLRRCVAR